MNIKMIYEMKLSLTFAINLIGVLAPLGSLLRLISTSCMRKYLLFEWFLICLTAGISWSRGLGLESVS